jgi:Flp pilus assembly protein TadG
MISLKKLWRDKRGNVLAIAAAALPLVIGAAGLASDTIQWTLWKRQLQRAADSAAIAGVYAKIQAQNIPGAINTDLDKDPNFARPAVASTHPGINLLAEPVVSYPPNASGYLDAVRVQLTLQKPLGFSSFFMSSPPTVRASATAATIETGAYCVVSLEQSSATGIKSSGTATVDLGCGMITNSTSLNAAVAMGNSSVHASPVAAVGNIQDSANWNGAELLPFTMKQADPFAGVNVPTFTSCQGGSNALGNNTQGLTKDLRSTQSNRTICVSDMNFQKGTTILGDNSTYLIDSGNLNVSSQATLKCSHCTIVLTNSSSGSTPVIGTVTINAGAELNMTAPTTGNFANILIYQDRRASSSNGANNKINGNSNSVMQGALYFPNQEMTLNGTGGMMFKCGQFVSRTVTFDGTGTIHNTTDSTCPSGGSSIKGKHVRLVA